MRDVIAHELRVHGGVLDHHEDAVVAKPKDVVEVAVWQGVVVDDVVLRFLHGLRESTNRFQAATGNFKNLRYRYCPLERHNAYNVTWRTPIAEHLSSRSRSHTGFNTRTACVWKQVESGT